MQTDSPHRFSRLIELLGAWSVALALLAIGWDVFALQEPHARSTAVAAVQAPTGQVASERP